jgi:hypothetical protein
MIYAGLQMQEYNKLITKQGTWSAYKILISLSKKITNMKKYFLALILGGSMALSVNAQEFKLPAPSPTATLKQDFSTSSIEIVYSRPAMRGRKVFGELVPFGQVWRTGANSATKVTFGEDVSVKGKPVKAGSYSLYTVPGQNEWKVIINKGIGNWGVSGFDAKDDVAEFMVPAGKAADAVQSFTISIDNITGTSCDIVLTWEHTKVSIPVVANNDKAITEYLESAINKPKRPYQQAANYYLETGKDLNKALTYADKAIEENPQGFWLYWLKARIYQKQGNKKEALVAAEKSATMAASTPYAAEYKRNAENLAKEMK